MLCLIQKVRRKGIRISCLFFLLLLACSCSNAPYKGSEVLGADEFVIDSYKIKEGKFSLLQLMDGKEVDPLSDELLCPYADVVHDGDILHIVFFHPTRADLVNSFASLNQSIGFIVQDGKVVLPDLDAVFIQGLTLEEARVKIQKEYEQHIKDVQVFLSFQNRIERKVELAGLVQSPTIAVDGRIRLYETLALAKVPPQANLFRSYLIRDAEMVPVDFYKLVKEGDMSQNVVMRGGDKIYVADASDSTVMVLGEVTKECLVNVPNGFVTLRKALAEAGGIPYTGDKSYIQVIRGNVLYPKIYTLNWKHIIRLPNDSMLLMPGDIVYVAAKPLTEWNRFVTQILPTLVGFDLVSRGIKSVGVNIP